MIGSMPDWWLKWVDDSNSFQLKLKPGAPEWVRKEFEEMMAEPSIVELPPIQPAPKDNN